MPATASANADDKRAVRLDFDLAAPPEKVWRALTQSDLLARWLMPNNMVAKTGHKFQFKSPVPAGAAWDGTVNCEVLEATPPKRLRLTWVGGGIDTVVSWTLTPSAGGTRLHLEQAGFGPDQPWAYDGATYGWQKFIGQELPKLLTTLK